jgi:hypothetical protein
MNPKSASEEPVISVNCHGHEQPDGGASQRARRVFLALARLIGRQMAREQYAARRKREHDARDEKGDDS